jgi:hypothetical protein
VLKAEMKVVDNWLKENKLFTWWESLVEITSQLHCKYCI